MMTQQSTKRPVRDLTSILEAARAIGATFMADPPSDPPPADDPPADPPSDPPDDDPPSKKAGDKGKPPKSRTGDDGDDPDPTDWKRESRKHETRAKQNKDAADKAAAEKAEVEQAKADAEKQNTELREQLGKLLGFTGQDEPPDPAKLQQALADRDRDLKSKDDVVASKDEEIAARDRTIAARDVELAAWREAMKQGVDAVTLMDLRSTERRLGALDPAAEEFPKLLETALKELVEQNPALKITAKVPDDAGRAGIGAAGAPDDAAVTPGTGRLRAAYSKT